MEETTGEIKQERRCVMKAGVQKESHRKYTEPEIEHACEKLRFLKNTAPQMGHAVEGLLDCFVEKLNTELTERTQAAIRG
jgi:hypothetical protein